MNESQRPTTVLNDSILEFELQPDDVAIVSNLRIVVESPRPGGGSSAQRILAVGYPIPGILSVTPDTIMVHNIAPELVIIGTGFAPASFVTLVGSAGPVTTTYVSATELRAQLSPIVGSYAREYDVYVVQPGGAGESIGRNLAVLNPVPVLDSVSIDSLIQFSGPRQVTAWGHDFVPGFPGAYVPGTMIQVNGQAREAVYLDSTTVRFGIGTGDVQAIGQLTFGAYSHTPGGGTSNTVAIPVVRPAPLVSALSPTMATVGDGDFLLTIDGLDFEPDAQVQINGADVATTFVSEFQVTALVGAASVASEGSLSVVVLNPARGLASAPTILPVLPVTPGIEAPIVIERANAFVLGDPVRNVFYASIPADAIADANSVLKIDGVSGATVDAVSVVGDPGRMAVSDDGQFLYVAMRAAANIVRIRLSDFEVDSTLETPRASQYGDERALDLVVLPGQPRRVVVTTQSAAAPNDPRVVVYHESEVLPRQIVGRWALATGETADAVYGYASLTVGRLTIESDGIRLALQTPQFGDDFTGRIESSGERVFSTNGRIFRQSTLQSVGTLAASGPVRPDVALGRVHFRVNTELRTYHATTGSLVGAVDIPEIDGLSSITRVGANRLALGGGTRIVLLRGSLIGP